MIDITIESGWWLTHPSERYEPVGVPIPNHQPTIFMYHDIFHGEFQICDFAPES